MLSDMKTFTVRDLDRRPGEVLRICDQEGVVRILRRDGHCYTIRPEQRAAREVPAEERLRWLKEHNLWMERTFPRPVSREQAMLVDRLIGGE